jgi:hypothetical protein
MGGSSGSGWSHPGDFSSLSKQAEDLSKRPAYNVEVNAYLQEMLKEFNDRDTGAIQQHLEVLQNSIQKDIEGSVDLLFGGSLRKNTYVNGLSDVDTLIFLNDTSLANKSPKEVLNYFEQKIRQRLPSSNVSTGDLAVTVKYSDKTEIQLLPAIKTATGFRIADPSTGQWSNVVRPDAFARKLTSVNQDLGGKVIPAIKLFKALVKNILPSNIKISGYHAESMAIEAFKGYQGNRTPKDMLSHFCREASNLVGSPIKDRTGQSLHVDDYLGESNNSARKNLSAHLTRIASRIEVSDQDQSASVWKKLFEE